MNDTQEKILSCAMDEFLEKGFLNASLRHIVKKAGVTTGAFYRYYDSKEILFEALVDEHAQHILDLYDQAVDNLEKLSGNNQTRQMADITDDCIMLMLDYVYDHYDAFKLLLQCSKGTQYDQFTHQLVMREVKSTQNYIKTLNDMGHHMNPISDNLIHIIASGMFSSMFEVVIHDMPLSDAKEYVKQLRRFYSAGWEELLGVLF
ncbi:MAG: TetR/AcrR family transcriptional regulator [Erysipelotrichaceae bacterium]|nr:TetR/AcrR family transcriptional regulator [Erysipelotrichaceae bacterium]